VTILVLGSEGFIGRHAVRFFLEKGWQVAGCDLFEAPTQSYRYIKLSRLSPEWEELMQQIHFNCCVNAAGSGNVSYSVTHPLIDFESNTLDVIRMLDALRKWQPSCRYLHISSAAVYGNPASLPVRESDPCKPVSPYGYHKWMSESLCHEYFSIYKLPVVIIRPFSVYGPGLQKQLFWDLLQKYRLNPEKIDVWGTGKESRDFIYIEDLIRSIECVLQKSAFECEVYNVASGREITIEEAVQKLFLQVDKNVEIYFNKRVRPGDPENWRADTTRLHNLGFVPSVDFGTGIVKLAEWYKNLK
jgi:UDP-glucose 4-epimerase